MATIEAKGGNAATIEAKEGKGGNGALEAEVEAGNGALEAEVEGTNGALEAEVEVGNGALEERDICFRRSATSAAESLGRGGDDFEDCAICAIRVSSS